MANDQSSLFLLPLLFSPFPLLPTLPHAPHFSLHLIIEFSSKTQIRLCQSSQSLSKVSQITQNSIRVLTIAFKLLYFSPYLSDINCHFRDAHLLQTQWSLHSSLSLPSVHWFQGFAHVIFYFFLSEATRLTPSFHSMLLSFCDSSLCLILYSIYFHIIAASH